MREIYLTRTQSRIAAMDHPVGDAFGGPAFGEKEDVGTVFSAVAPAVVGGLFGGGGSSAPSAPDYGSSAAATAAGNLNNLRTQLAANRLNQVTPYGSLNYSQTGTDQYGNPTYTATQQFSPQQQAILDQTQGLQSGLLGTAQAGMPYLSGLLANPTINQSNLPASMINGGQTYVDAANKLMQPTFDRQQNQLNTQLANQGVGMGSDAYKYAQRDLADNQNRASLEATMQGIQANQAARSSEIQNQANLMNQPLNIMNALRTGNTVTAPTYAQSAQMGYTPGADYLGAAQAGYNANLNAYNAQVGQQNSFMNGLFGLGQAAILRPGSSGTGGGGGNAFSTALNFFNGTSGLGG